MTHPNTAADLARQLRERTDTLTAATAEAARQRRARVALANGIMELHPVLTNQATGDDDGYIDPGSTGPYCPTCARPGPCASRRLAEDDLAVHGTGPA